MSLIDDFMSKVIDLDEKEKEDTILFLAEAIINDNYEFLKKISPKVQDIVLHFLTRVEVKSWKGRKKEDEHFYEATTKDPHLKKVYFKKGGEEDGTSGRYEKDQGCRT